MTGYNGIFKIHSKVFLNTFRRNRMLKDLFLPQFPHTQTPVNETLRGILAEYMEPDDWHQFGERIEVPMTERIKIESEKYDIYEMTYDLLDYWLIKYESNATLGVST